MIGRTVILVSHHVQLCAPGAAYIVALDNGRVQFEGSRDAFDASGVLRTLIQTTEADEREEEQDEKGGTIEKIEERVSTETEDSTVAPSKASSVKLDKKPPRKLVEEEKRAVGRIGKEIWETYIKACGNIWYWFLFGAVLTVGAASPVAENGWLR